MMVKDINPGAGGSSPGALTNVNGTLYFSANDGTHGFELWKSDGTAAGNNNCQGHCPARHELVPAVSDDPQRGALFQGQRRYPCYELWKSDGTAAGTVLLEDINSGPTDSFPPNLRNAKIGRAHV